MNNQLTHSRTFLNWMVLFVVTLLIGVTAVVALPSVSYAGGAGNPGGGASSGGTPGGSSHNAVGNDGALKKKPKKGGSGTGKLKWDSVTFTTYSSPYSACGPNDLGDAAIGGTKSVVWSSDMNDAIVEGTGYNMRFFITGLGMDINIAKRYGATDSIKCIYPPRWYKISGVNCVVSSTASVTQDAPGPRRTIKTASNTSAWGNGTKTYDACMSSAINVDIYADTPNYGRYEAKAVTTKQTADFKIYTTADPRTGVVPATEVTLGGTYTVNPNTTRWQFTCAGFSNGWGKASAYNQSECGPDQTTNIVKYQCIVDDGNKTPLVNGVRTANATVFRDGAANSVAWSRPSITGTARGVPEGQTQILRSGTPWNTTKTYPGATTNDVELWRNGASKFTTIAGTGWMPKIQNDKWEFRAYWASNADAPTVITPQFKWKAQWLTSTKTVASISSNGLVSWSTKDIVVDAEALCTGTPLTINVVRATTAGNGVG